MHQHMSTEAANTTPSTLDVMGEPDTSINPNPVLPHGVDRCQIN